MRKRQRRKKCAKGIAQEPRSEPTDFSWGRARKRPTWGINLKEEHLQASWGTFGKTKKKRRSAIVSTKKFHLKLRGANRQGVEKAKLYGGSRRF